MAVQMDGSSSSLGVERFGEMLTQSSKHVAGIAIAFTC